MRRNMWLLQCSISGILAPERGLNVEKKTMSTSWNTKYGPRRVRHDPPTLDEAIFAARGLTDDLDQQVEIAAGLMDMPLDEVRAVLVKTPAPRKNTATVAFTGRAGTHRAVVVERKPTRRLMTGRGAG